MFKLGSGSGFGLGVAAVGLVGLGIGRGAGLVGLGVGRGAGLVGCFSVLLVLVSTSIDLSCEIDACNINSSICVCTAAFSSALQRRIALSERCTSLMALMAG